MANEISLKNEIFRKMIHLSTSFIPLLYFFVLTERQAVLICAILFLIFLSGDISRNYITKMRQIYEKVFGKLIRNREREKGLNGATLLFLAFFLSCLLFEKNVAVAAMLLLSIADSLAAIVGKSFGKRRFLGKTVLGSFTFFVSASIIFAFIFQNIFIIFGVAAISTIIEAIPTGVNDNLSIPLLSGALLSFII